MFLSLATDTALHLSTSDLFLLGVWRASVLTPAGECRINYRLFPSKKTHMDYQPLMILAAVPALLRLPVTRQILYSFSWKCMLQFLGIWTLEALLQMPHLMRIVDYV